MSCPSSSTEPGFFHLPIWPLPVFDPAKTTSSAVVLACDFAGNSHFSREYRKHFATTPAAERAKP